MARSAPSKLVARRGEDGGAAIGGVRTAAAAAETKPTTATPAEAGGLRGSSSRPARGREAW
eukprot:173132-Prymnesium_polylepis.1